ncbi:acireductone dioxygenase [Pseudoxanthomonas kalamensis DSM 18571]|uniref:1,2-dihydroxy-3-keto-5-methylthiopentene dioxygenase n=1 Tax=Pseudoxanthomonas kalamensis TaxID=289483 RepID=UPI00139142CD|nr:acireductone dioxygenase [Pseudoxanthomonas kalamensis]KAF1710467.1 acireductone dioxygenase [Pseudoxanthomonas kalamensis DSM 18571]
MSRLRIFSENDPATPEFASHDPEAIADELRAIGVTFERWTAGKPIAAGASPEAVMDAYRADIERISAERGFTTVDVVSIAPDNPNKEAARAKFLEEHYHQEDEVRFFVDGAGLFTLHVGDKIYEIECCKDDLISVPDGITHWFDMGAEPRFVAIRFFQQPDGWIGHFTGSDIAGRFPRYTPEASV